MNEEVTNATSDVTTSEITNMEVHHHPDLHHRKKHWKEYFLEFLMIFLAVTLGFFAESYREYLADRKKEKEYMVSLVEDLKSDTAEITSTIKDNILLINRIKLFSALLNQYHSVDSINNKLYKSFIGIDYYSLFVPTQRTIVQLKSSGGLRLITNKSVTNEILDYDNDLNRLQNLTADYKNWGANSFLLAEGIVNLNYFKEVYTETDSLLKSSTANFNDAIDPLYRKTSLKLIDDDPKLLAKYANSVTDMKSIDFAYIHFLKGFKSKELHLIQLIKKEYKLQ